jgi:hypothetical protein
VTALGLVIGAALALVLLGREIDRALFQVPDGASLRPSLGIVLPLGAVFVALVTMRILDYL